MRKPITAPVLLAPATAKAASDYLALVKTYLMATIAKFNAGPSYPAGPELPTIKTKKAQPLTPRQIDRNFIIDAVKRYALAAHMNSTVWTPAVAGQAAQTPANLGNALAGLDYFLSRIEGSQYLGAGARPALPALDWSAIPTISVTW